MKFYLGTHVESWLGSATVPLFVSRRRLCRRKSLPHATYSWVLDSGAFSELSMFGHWTITPQQYAQEVRRYSEDIGSMEWAASMDYMCEPWIVKNTGLSIHEHQERTVDNYLELCSIASDLPFVPVLQGWAVSDYLRHVEMYGRAGVALDTLPVVGLGSVCRRQGTAFLEDVAHALQPIRLHGFGVKLQGLVRARGLLHSADSMAWSFAARREAPLAGCTHHSCANCLRYALLWRARVVDAIRASADRMVQGRFGWTV